MLLGNLTWKTFLQKASLSQQQLSQFIFFGSNVIQLRGMASVS